MGYLKLEDIIPDDFLKKPRTIVIEAGNGFGKTHCMSLLSSLLQGTRNFERIYFLQYSQKGCENVVKKVTKFGGKVIWHIGIEHFCPMEKIIREVRALGIPPSYACYFCPYFKNKQKLAFVCFKELLEDQGVQVVKPEVITKGLLEESKVCIQPIIRSYVLTPSFELDKRVSINYTPVIVTPSQLMLNHTVIGRWSKYARRQRKERKNLMIIDEADTIFYSSLRVEIPEIEITDYDREILREFSSTKRDLTKLETYYNNIKGILNRIVSNLGFPKPEDIKEFNDILEKAKALLGTFEYRKKQIVNKVLKDMKPTCVFRLASVFSELSHIENLEYALSTVEKTNNGFIIEDYDFGVKVLLDNAYPWKYFWKIVLSATFPTTKIVESRFLSFRSKGVLLASERKTKEYQNVYVSTVAIFPEDNEILNRNYEIDFAIAKVIEAIKKSVKRYRQLFGRKLSGLCLWLGNTKQMESIINQFEQVGFKVEKHRKHAIIRIPGLEIFVSYVGSPVSRGIDMDKYDISIAISPLLRPPRNLAFLDVIDFARAVAETIQSVMRIVRSPKPKTPKLVIIEKSMTRAFYGFFYPDWFKKLFAERFIEL